MSPWTRVCRARTEWKDLTAPLRAVVSLPPPKCAQHLPAVGINPHSGKKGKRAHYWQSRKKNRKEKKERVEGGEFCAPRSGAARSGFTRGLRRCSGFLRPAPTAELRHRHSHHAEYPPRDRATLGMLPARPSERPGLQGLRAPPAPGLLRAARASLPRTQPLRLPDRHCHPHLGGDGEGGMRGPPRSLPRAFPPLSAAGSSLGLGFGPPRAGGGASARSRGDPRVRPPHRSWGGEKQPR